MTSKPKATSKSARGSDPERDDEHIAYLASLIDNISHALISTDMEFHILEWNSAAEEMYGWTAAEVIGHPAGEFIQSEYENTSWEEIIKRVLEAGIWRGELTQHRKDGTRFPVMASVSPVKDKTGKPVGFITINRDITEQKRAEQQVLQMKRLYAALSQVNQTIVRVKNREELYRKICDVAVKFGDFSLAWIGLLEEASGDVHPVTANGLDVNAWPLPVVNVQTGAYQDTLLATAIRTSQVITSEAMQTNKKLKNLYAEMPEYADYSVAAIPFFLRGQPVGVLSLVSRRAGLFKAAEEVHLLEEMGLDISFALEAMQIEEERRHAEEQIQRQLKHLKALHIIDSAISSGSDLKTILDIVLQQVVSQLEIDAGAILLVNPQLQTLEYAASRGFHSNVLHHTSLNTGQGYAGRAILERKTIHIPRLMETGGKLAAALHVEHESFVDYYAAPLIVKGEVKGVLEIYHRSILKTDSEWLEFLEILTAQAAIAIDNTQLFEILQRSNVELEQRVAQRTAELHQTNIELERANKTKDEFLANMSHELRTPLTSILGLSESLLEQRRGFLNEYQQRSLELVVSSGEHLLQLINDILDLSKIEAGRFDYYPQLVEVDEICRSSLAFIKAQAAKKSIAVTYVQDISISKISADPRRLKQILVNLLSNAVKFTPGGGKVILQVNADTEEAVISFSVIDTGIGIAPADLGRLFKPFVQVDSRLNRQYEGTGLGLALVQKLTDLHGGSVHVESEVGKGSRFTVNLPCLPEETAKLEAHDMYQMKVLPEKRETPRETSPQQGVILFADDNMPTILTIGDYLESYGYQVVIAHDGLEALQMAEASQPDLILMDIQMPVMDGLEVIARLRENPRSTTTPIIALTALAMPGDRERCLQAGASEYMSKPVSLKALRQTIEKLLQS